MSRLFKPTEQRKFSNITPLSTTSTSQAPSSPSSLFLSPSVSRIHHLGHHSSSSLSMGNSTLPAKGSETYDSPRSYKDSTMLSKTVNDLKFELKAKECIIKELRDSLSQTEHKHELLKLKIRLLKKENKQLKTDCRDNSFEFPTGTSLSDKLEQEVIKRREDVRKLENQLNAHEEQTKRIIKEKDKKIRELEAEIRKGAEKEAIVQEGGSTRSELYGIIKNFQKENSKLREKIQESPQKNIRKEEHAYLESQFKELEAMQGNLLLENKELKEELEFLRTGRGKTLIDFSKEIQNIRKNTNQLLILLQTWISGKDISLKLIFGFEETWKNKKLTVEQIEEDFQCINADLEKIRTIIADFHAEQCGNQVCATQ
ncbi:unnamed protein product [Blepharisma stoltei]|uniref:Uncharacterized protein n=1 Tax=Blepharisma stoltei TaxID=1481888 RepID=A0AAU9JP47_9CILI|nr:unnamed protein product [Blepharisma stoltei]